MARPRKYASAAERQAAYKLRARQRAAVAAPEDGDGVPGAAPEKEATPLVKNEAAGDSLYKGGDEHECDFKERLGRCNAANRLWHGMLRDALGGPQSVVALSAAIRRVLDSMEGR